MEGYSEAKNTSPTTVISSSPVVTAEPKDKNLGSKEEKGYSDAEKNNDNTTYPFSYSRW
jgi:hypothetical protein